MKVGTLVRYANPQSAYEAGLTFVVVDDRETRSLIQSVGDMQGGDYSIVPQECVADSDLEKV